MSVISIHPEELLDKLSAGQLSSSERELLEAHLASCDVCRFELEVSVDFQNEARALAARAPAALPLGSIKLGAERPDVERKRSRRVMWALAAAMLIASTGAIASATRVRQVLADLFRHDGSSALAASTAPGLHAAPAPPRVEAPPAEQQGAVGIAASAAPEQSAVAASAAPLRAPTTLARTTAAVAVGDAESAETLFAAANSARRRGDLAQAGSLYRELQQRFPGSQEAGLSQVTLSMSLLDRGDAAGALAGFDKYLARARRPLEAEALVGRARALGALGSRAAEAGAWREVQRKYPSSVYSRQAEDRLAALGRP